MVAQGSEGTKAGEEGTSRVDAVLCLACVHCMCVSEDIHERV